MNDRQTCSQLAHWLRRQLETGVLVGSDVLAFMEATFGTDQLQEVLTGDSDSETDSLLELIFYPDNTLRTRYETRWGQVAFSPADQQATAARLTAEPLIAALKLPGQEALLHIAAPSFALETLVQRLNITWQPAAALDQALQHQLGREQRTGIRVLLRHAPVPWREGQVQLAARYLRRMPAGANDFTPCLRFLLSLLSELTDNQDPYDFLASKKLFCFQSLCKAQDFQRRLQTSNMEILMLQGERAAHGDMDQWLRWMRMIDRICLALFDRMEFFQQPAHHHIDLTTTRQGDDEQVRTVIRTLI
jgi:hypothetical protein